jgi:hypothetical protein
MKRAATIVLLLTSGCGELVTNNVPSRDPLTLDGGQSSNQNPNDASTITIVIPPTSDADLGPDTTPDSSTDTAPDSSTDTAPDSSTDAACVSGDPCGDGGQGRCFLGLVCLYCGQQGQGCCPPTACDMGLTCAAGICTPGSAR